MKVTLLMAMTVDGKIARDSNQFVDWTNKEDKKIFVLTTKQAGVVIMGSKTYDTIGKPLPGRMNVVMTRDKNRKSTFDNLIFTDQLPRKVLNDLKDMGYSEVALIGGSEINTLFAKEITQVQLTVVPKMFGKGLSLFCSPMDMDLSLKYSKVMSDDHLLLIYDVNHK